MRFIAGLIAGPMAFYYSLPMLPEGVAAFSLLYWLPYIASVAFAVLIAGPWRIRVYENWLWALVVTVLLVVVVFVFDLFAALAYGCSKGICL
jgi:purine-cytosine permease-like protein